MGLHLRGRIWQADYFADGRRVQESTGTANRREAERFLALRVSEVHRGVFTKEPKTTLEQLWERYLPHARMHKRSFKRDEQLYSHLKDFFGNPLLRDITPARLEQYQQARGAKVAPATVNRETSLLRHLFNLGERWNLSSGNPHRHVRMLREDNFKCETLSPEEQDRLVAELPTYVRDLVLFDLNTGLRVSDLLGLKWEDVNIERRLIQIIVKKNRKVHEVALNSTALEIIERQPKTCEYVFANPMSGKQVKSVRGSIERAVKQAGLKRVTFHMFRHTVATRLLHNGADILAVKEILGHSSINTTLRYIHSSAERQRHQMEKLDGRDTYVTVMPKRGRIAV